MIRSTGQQRAKWSLAVLILLGTFAFSSQVADAHAILESSTPADQSILATAPSKVSLTFSEPVTLLVGSVRVFDESGKQVQIGLPSRDSSGSVVSIRLRAGLATGSYAVAWRVISADTHPVHGGLVFSIGRAGHVGSLENAVAQSNSKPMEAAGDVLRALGYLGCFLIVGAAVFVAFIEESGAERRRINAWLTSIGAVTILVQLLSLPVAAALATGGGPGDLFDPGVAGQVLGQGTAFTIAGVAVGVALGLATFVISGSLRRVSALGSLVVVPVAFAMSGHTRVTDPVVGMVLLDAVHVAAGTVWVGGLAMLVLSIARRSRAGSAPEIAAAEVVAFSRWATVAILAVGGSGIVMAWIEIGSWRGLFTTGYGQLVLAKMALVVVLAGLGAFNHFRLVPLVKRRPDHAGAWRYLRRTLGIEAVAMVAVLSVTGVLVNAIPARTALERQAVFSRSAPLGTGTANLVIDPLRVGPTALHIYVLDAHGRADNAPISAAIEAYQPRFGIGPIDETLQRAGPGHFLTNGTVFTAPGDWQLTVEVRVDEFDQSSATFRVHVGR